MDTSRSDRRSFFSEQRSLRELARAEHRHNLPYRSTECLRLVHFAKLRANGHELAEQAVAFIIWASCEKQRIVCTRARSVPKSDRPQAIDHETVLPWVLHQ